MDQSNVNLKRELKVIDTARRHVIKINDITGYRPNYKKTIMRSRELISTPVKNLSVFCNEYIPEHFPSAKHIAYVLNVNGTDHEIVPINCERNGKKIIRTLKTDMSSAYVDYINEDIKSAFLTIIINSHNLEETPYISDLKILAGGDTNV